MLTPDGVDQFGHRDGFVEAAQQHGQQQPGFARRHEHLSAVLDLETAEDPEPQNRPLSPQSFPAKIKTYVDAIAVTLPEAPAQR
ncbi:hypothetical protein Aab01nite_61480 [Paractinoplanes abujensis]|nr:hypothetical protein Aab01nite_61480 [Actinoplanes abujensis]